ncbi:PP2C family serine/threonine-protein phosphatase [Lederbergia panacisoli]|uniref:PP2C family serine/threonine-protein phosphatase n=1 Tax=Lederbergia panacisoli TaxID=1255251 RepID=UPI00214C1E49|nr:PP2C family serine/threonine-protein phosphatase [Lederbergia panacisoli]MCR2822638.1 protein phosphatase 2C domain-containing protein [Lederbergia panacisoli]
MIHLENEYSEVHAFQTAKESNVLCGDSFYLTLTEDYVLCVLADGLGSGKYAHEASQAVVSVVRSNPEESVNTLMDFCNKVLLKKRGAAVAIFKVDFKRKEFEYSCVGNIRFYMYPPEGKLIYPMPVTGYLSGRPQKYRTQKYAYESKSKFLIHTDGFVNVNTKNLLNSCQSIPALVAHLKVKQVNTLDDMSFIVGTLL